MANGFKFDKKHTNAQRLGRMEKVLSQLYVAMVDLNARVTALDGGKPKQDEEEVECVCLYQGSQRSQETSPRAN